MPTLKLNKDHYVFMPFIVILLLMFSPVASAEQGVVYKNARPLKQIADEKTATKTEEKEEAERGYLYDPREKTDPFKSFIAAREEQKEKEKKKPRTYLETLDLSQLNLSVIVIGPKGKWALVKDPKGVGHVIRKGTPIGTNGGVVYSIKEGEVIVREEYKDFRGKKQFRDISKKPPGQR
jgi:Tfp pilus assembly protein PilP